MERGDVDIEAEYQHMIIDFNRNWIEPGPHGHPAVGVGVDNIKGVEDPK